MAKTLDPKDFAFAFKLPPEKAIEYLKRKGYAITWDWHEGLAAAERQAFTIAKVLQMDILVDVRTAIEQAVADGTTIQDFRKKVEPMLKSKGWWGRTLMTNPNTGTEERVQLGSPHRVKLIYRQNVQTSYMAGRRVQQRAVADQRPYLQFFATIDNRTTRVCRELDGKIVRQDDPTAESYYGPNHFLCRLRAVTLSEAQVRAQGLNVSTGNDLKEWQPEEGFNRPPDVPFQPDLSKYPKEIVRQYTKAVKERDHASIS